VLCCDDAGKSGVVTGREQFSFLVYFEFENRIWWQHFWFYLSYLEKNSCIGKKCWNGVLAFKKVAERCSGTSWLDLSTDC